MDFKLCVLIVLFTFINYSSCIFDDYLKDVIILGGNYNYNEICQENGKMFQRLTAANDKFVNVVVQSEYSSEVFRNLTFTQAQKFCNESLTDEEKLLDEIPIIAEYCVKEEDREIFVRNSKAMIRYYFNRHCYPTKRMFDQHRRNQCSNCFLEIMKLCMEKIQTPPDIHQQDAGILHLLNGENCFLNIKKALDCIKDAADKNLCSECYDLATFPMKRIESISPCE